MASKSNSHRHPRPEGLGKPHPPSPARASVSGPLFAALLIVFAMATLVQLAMYFDLFGLTEARPDNPAVQRRTSLLFLVSPDQMLTMWSGNRLEYFSLLDRTPIFLAASAILLGAWLAGVAALDLLGVTRQLDRLERAVFALAAGLNLLSLYALAVGLACGLRVRWLFFGLLAALVAYGAARLAFTWRRHAVKTAAGNSDERRWWWWLLAAAPYAVVIVLGGMLPPYEYDVREYHLQVPKEWFLQGRIDFLPHNIYGNMPLGAELTALWGMALMGGDDAWWWGAIVGKTVMACYPLITAAGVVALGRRIHSTAAGVLAAVIYLSLPWTGHIALVGYNEGPTALYFVTALHLVWLARGSLVGIDRSRMIALAGFLAGSAVACKYPPALFLVVPMAGWLAIGEPLVRVRALPSAAGEWFRSALIATVIFLIGTSAGCGLWLGKNLAQSGNPTYPLLYDVFAGQTRTPEKNAQWERAHSPQPDAHGQRFTMERLLHDVAWNLWQTKGASVALAPLALAAWLATRHRGLVTMVGIWMLFVFVVWWLLTHRLDRFLTPLLPVAALLAGIGAVALPQPAWRRATLALVVVGVIVQFPFVSLFLGDHRYFAPMAALRRDDPRIAEITGQRIDSPHRWLNANVPPGNRVLLVGDAEPFDLEMPVVYNTCFDDCQFARIFQGRTRAERLATLKQERITHIFFSWAHLARYRSPGNYGYTSDYVTRDLVHRELVAEQRLLRKIAIDSPDSLELPEGLRLQAELGEIFEVAER